MLTATQEDISQKATSMVKEYGQDAVIEAEKELQKASESGNEKAFYYWNSVRFAIVDYLCK